MALSVTCPSCGKSFQLAQEIYDRKVAGKIVSIRCKQCQAGIRIDATQPGGLRVLGATPATNESAQGVRARQPTLIGMMGPSGAVTSGASAEGALWAVDSGGNGEDRELDDATIAREIAAGMIGPATLVWRDGMSDWLEVQQVPQLAKHLLAAKPAEPPKVAAPLPSAPAKQTSAPEAAALPPVEPKRPAPAPAAPAPPAPAPAPAAAAPVPAPAAPAAAAPAPAPAAAAAPAPAARPAATKPTGGALPGVPVMHEEEDEDEATMIFRSSGEAVSKLGLGELPQEKTPVPAGPPPAAGKPMASGLGAPGAPRSAFGRPAGSAPLATGTRPVGSPPGAGPGGGRAAPRAGSSPAASPAGGSSPLAAEKPPVSPAAPVPPAAPAPRSPAAAPPPPRAKQPSAPVLPREVTPPPEPAPAPAAVAPPPPRMFPPPDPIPVAAPPAPTPPPPSPPPAAVPTAPAAPAPMRAKQPSASGLPRGLYPPPERPAPPPPSPPPGPPSAAPEFPGVQGGSQPLAQLAPNPFAVATTTDLEFTSQRSKTPLIIGGLVLVLAAAGIAVAVTSSGARPAPPPVPPPAPAAPALTTPPVATTAETTTAPEATTAPPAKPSDDIAGTPRPSASNGDFSQLFAAGAQQAQKGGTTGSAKPFDPEEAKTAIAAALKAVAACREPGGPSGQTSASITFDATGRVSSVTVGAPFSGTSTGTCIIGALKNVKVTPFTGLPGTVSQPVSLL